MVRYPVVLLDLDHTLFDSDESERLAFARTLAAAGVRDPDALLPTYVGINTALWAAVERGERTAVQVRTERFEQLVAACGLDADPDRLADDFVAGLGACGDLYPGAAGVLDRLAAVATLALVTNGLSEVQRARVARLDLADHFAAVVISGEVGVAKPAAAFFDVTFAALRAVPGPHALMVGDSLSADVAGGAAYGLATCWYNPHGRDAGASARIDHVIGRLDELVDVVTADR